MISVIMDQVTLIAGVYLVTIALLASTATLREALIIRLPIGLIGIVMIARAGSALGLF